MKIRNVLSLASALCLLAAALPVQAATVPHGGLIPEPTPHIETLDENTLLRSYEFTAQSRPFVYTDAPKTFVFEGRTYTMLPDSAEYFVKSEAPHYDMEAKEFMETLEKTKVSDQNDDIFQGTFPIDQDGFYGDIPRVSVAYNTSSEQGSSRTMRARVSYGEQTETPTAPETIEKSGQPYTFDRWDTSGGRWETNFYADLRLISENTDATLFSGQKISLDTTLPKWESIELALMGEMQLDPGAHVIVSAKWLNDLQIEEEGYSRKIRFTMQRHVLAYTALYIAEVPGGTRETISAVATYKGTLEKPIENGVDYTVLCKITYAAPPLPTPEPTPSPEPAPSPQVEEAPAKKDLNPLLKFALIILGGAALGALAFMGKNYWDKRNADDEE